MTISAVNHDIDNCVSLVCLILYVLKQVFYAHFRCELY